MLPGGALLKAHVAGLVRAIDRHAAAAKRDKRTFDAGFALHMAVYHLLGGAVYSVCCARGARAHVAMHVR